MAILGLKAFDTEGFLKKDASQIRHIEEHTKLTENYSSIWADVASVYAGRLFSELVTSLSNPEMVPHLRGFDVPLLKDFYDFIVKQVLATSQIPEIEGVPVGVNSRATLEDMIAHPEGSSVFFSGRNRARGQNHGADQCA